MEIWSACALRRFGFRRAKNGTSEEVRNRRGDDGRIIKSHGRRGCRVAVEEEDSGRCGDAHGKLHIEKVR